MHAQFTADDGRIVRGEITRLNRKTATACCSASAIGESARRARAR